VNDSTLRLPVKGFALVGLVLSLSSVTIRAQRSSPPAAADGSILSFPPVPSASVTGPTLQKSTMKWRKEPERLRPGAPNVLIVLIDDVGFAVPDTFGGEVHTPTLSRLRDAGISYDAFHTTSICSPSRAALLTGRNHHRVGNGTIAERASHFDGYSGIVPKTWQWSSSR
jgi:Sulfatase